ncbi:MAG: phosphoserine phosphatase SerB [Sutterellaceae bacterium]|nr:phosphoserine phosphatase SerB [Sutterellaceae bacterium]MDD7442893.1 phosphoserine phosphatase SerB [Sutterellaceae bacterium]MDY2867538.1 phosphoserine phosphatase SerB [Mesosutterella sp.]
MEKQENLCDVIIQGEGLTAASLPSVVANRRFVARDTARGAVRLTGIPESDAMNLVGLFQSSGLDAVAVRPGLRLTDFRLFASDLDSTLASVETLDTVAKESGYGDSVAKITEAAMRGEIRDYAQSLEERIRAIKGCPQRNFIRFSETMPFNPGAEKLVAACRAAGLEFHIVTGGFDESAGPAARRLGADGFHCNKLEVKDGLLTGRVYGPDENGGKIVDSDGKKRIVEGLCGKLGIGLGQAITAGDGWNDVKMLAAAGLGAAYHAKPRVRAIVPHQINVLGLDSILNWFEDGPEWAAKAGFAD